MKARIRMISMMMMSKRLWILMQQKMEIGSLMHSISAHPSLLARPHTAKREISHTRIPRTGATSCIRRKEREEKASKEVALFCSQKEEREVPRAKENPKEKAKESREKAKVIAKAKGRKERTLEA